MLKTNIALAIHGGAGPLNPKRYTSNEIKEYEVTLNESLKRGYKILQEGGTSLEATKESVLIMEDSPLFNAGKGSVLGNNGLIEMDASIMCGKSLNAGAVSNVSQIKNPILLADKIMTDSIHTQLCKEGAEEFAYLHGLEFCDKEYFYTEKRIENLKKAKEKGLLTLDHAEGETGTVGAVALDGKGNLAAATSTGGMTNKAYGRVSDTSLIGSGTYANNLTCAISGTGSGDHFIRSVFCHDFSAQIEYKESSLEEAGKVVLEKLKAIGGQGGYIAISPEGEIVMDFNSLGMFRGWKNSSDQFVAIF